VPRSVLIISLEDLPLLDMNTSFGPAGAAILGQSLAHRVLLHTGDGAAMFMKDPAFSRSDTVLTCTICTIWNEAHDECESLSLNQGLSHELVRSRR
jgi:hypothetical protein